MTTQIMNPKTIIDYDRFERWNRKAFKIIGPLPPVDKSIDPLDCEYCVVTPLDIKYWSRFEMGVEALLDAEKMFGIGFLREDSYDKIKLCAHQQFLADWGISFTQEEIENLKSGHAIISRPLPTQEFRKVPWWANRIYWSDHHKEWRCEGRPEGRDHSEEVHLKHDWRMGDYFYVQEEFAYEHGMRDVMGDGNGPDPNIVYYRDNTIMVTDFHTDEFKEVSRDFDPILANMAGWQEASKMQEQHSRFLLELTYGYANKSKGQWTMELRFKLVRKRIV